MIGSVADYQPGLHFLRFEPKGFHTSDINPSVNTVAFVSQLLRKGFAKTCSRETAKKSSATSAAHLSCRKSALSPAVCVT